MQSAKRSKTEPEKGQLTLSQFHARLDAAASKSDLSLASTSKAASRQGLLREQPPPQNISFDTVLSDRGDPVWSENDDDDPNSSNNTSMLSDVGGRESHWSGGTQLEQDFLHDPSVNKSFRAADSIAANLKEQLDKLPTEGPFRGVKRQLLHDLPYWYVFELYRISVHVGCDVGPIFHKIKTRCAKELPSFHRYWKEVPHICKEENSTAPVCSAIKEWTYEDNSYVDEASGRSVQLSARLDFSRTPDKQLFDLTLNPIEVEKSCRFHRKFGADRFMVLDIPSFAPEYPKYLPEKLRKTFKPEEIHEKIFSWLANRDLYIAGRIWRVFYVEPKDVNKKKRKEEGSRQKVHLFAVHGFDFAAPTASATPGRHQALSLLDLIQWHLPLLDNKQSTDLKLFARIHLGLSKTAPTVILDPSELIYVPDKRATDADGKEMADGEIMTDGHGRMSPALASEVWKRIAKAGESMPSAFQARISGAKGLWTVHNDNSHPQYTDKVGRNWWLEVTDSQRKINIPQADEFQRTFEVVKTSHPCTSAHLNIQLINILEHRGVPRECLDEVMLAEMAEYYDSLVEAMGKGRLELRRWRQIHHPARSSMLEMAWCGELPDDREDELDMLLEAGFEPAECRYMVGDVLKNLIALVVEIRKEKLWIQIPHSTNVFCVPDTLGVLQPGEVQLNLSQPISDMQDWELEGRKVLVARNPAHLTSDIQAVKFVYRPELRHLKDVIIFPTQGAYPLAGMLSGGDYDGDTITVIWDERLTESFESVQVPELPTKQQSGVKSETQIVGSIFTGSQPNAQQLNKFMHRCCMINGVASRLGDVTKLLEKLIYAHPDNIMTIEGRKLAALAGYLVDGPKQGDSFSTRTWRDLRNVISNRYQLFLLPDTPAYDDENAITSSHKLPNGECANILDHLKFDVADAKSKQILQDFNQKLVPVWTRDADLDEPYQKAWRRAERAKGEQRQAIKSLLNDAKAQTVKVHTNWQTRHARNEHMKNQKDIGKDAVTMDFRTMTEETKDELEAIEPLQTDCYIYHDFLEDGGGKGTDWAILKTSLLYHEHYKAKMPWKLAGEELCHIKAAAVRRRGGRVRVMTQDMRDHMRFNTKKQLQSAEVIEDDASDETTNIVEE